VQIVWTINKLLEYFPPGQERALPNSHPNDDSRHLIQEEPEPGPVIISEHFMMRSEYRHTAIPFWALSEIFSTVVFVFVAIGITSLSHAGEPASPATDYSRVGAAINEAMRAYHYNPAELEHSWISAD